MYVITVGTSQPLHAATYIHTYIHTYMNIHAFEHERNINMYVHKYDLIVIFKWYYYVQLLHLRKNVKITLIKQFRHLDDNEPQASHI